MQHFHMHKCGHFKAINMLMTKIFNFILLCAPSTLFGVCLFQCPAAKPLTFDHRPLGEAESMA